MNAVDDNIQAAGNSLTTATALSAATSIVTGGTAGGGVGLQAIPGGGTREIVNRWAGNLLAVYPPSGQRFESYGVNMPLGIGYPNAQRFSVAKGSTTWRAY